MTIDQAVSNFPTTMGFPTMDTSGTPAEVRSQTAAYYDWLLELYEVGTLESEVELSYALLSAQRTREGLQEYQEYVAETAAASPPAPSFDTPVPYLKPPQFRTCRQARTKKTSFVAKPKKRPLDMFEKRQLRYGTIPPVLVMTPHLVALELREHIWLAQAKLARKDSRRRLARFRAYFVCSA